MFISETRGPGLSSPACNASPEGMQFFHLLEPHPQHVAFVIVLIPLDCMMTAPPPGITSVFQARKMENNVEVTVKGSLRHCFYEGEGEGYTL